jgi:hypothetical protein
MADERIPCVKCGEPTAFVLNGPAQIERCDICALRKHPWVLNASDVRLLRAMRIRTKDAYEVDG